MRRGTPAESFAPRLLYGRYLQDQLAAADVRIETAEVVNVIPGAPVRLALNDGRESLADAVVLASGRPQHRMPTVERAFAPVLSESANGRIVVDPRAPGTLNALGSRRPDSVVVIGSGLPELRVNAPATR